ncbi:MAG: DUF1579 family protein [Betaproteobacteria bacterium]
MKIVRLLGAATLAVVTTSILAGIQPPAADGPITMEKLNELGPEGQALARSVGTWDVTFTTWDTPGAKPTVVTGLVAERRMVGPMLEEELRPASTAAGAPFVRVDDLTFNRVEGRWQYLSMDSRVPYGLMTAASLDADPPQRVFLSFVPFATAGSGPGVNGQMFRMEQVIQRQDAGHETKDQFFTPASGSPTKWLAKRYSYTRRR